MTRTRVELDYVAAPRHRRAAGLIVLAISLGAGGWLLERHREVRLELDRIEASRSLLPRERRTAPRKSAEEEIKGAEAVLRQLSLPWAAMIHAVEGAAVPEVAVLQMQPEARQRQLRLTAEARNERAMLEYLGRMSVAEALADVHLASHQVMVEDPRRPIQFTVLARLKGVP